MENECTSCEIFCGLTITSHRSNLRMILRRPAMTILRFVFLEHFKPLVPRNLLGLEAPLEADAVQFVDSVSANSTLTKALVVISSVFISLIFSPLSKLLVAFIILRDVAVSISLMKVVK